MAKKRTYNRKKTAKRATKKQATRLDIAIVGLFILSILSAVLIYTKSGIIGIKLTEVSTICNFFNSNSNTYVDIPNIKWRINTK